MARRSQWRLWTLSATLIVLLRAGWIAVMAVVLQNGSEVDPGFGTGRVVGSERFRRMLDGANDEKDETEDRRGAEGEDCAGGAAGTVDGCGPVATVRSPPEPDLRLEEAAAGAGGPRL